MIAEHIEVDGESRYNVSDVIGKNDSYGVKCLRWSGAIAGETSQAYDDVSGYVCFRLSETSNVL